MGLCVGASVGTPLGAGVGAFVGLCVGCVVGTVVGCIVGSVVGVLVTKHFVSSVGSLTYPSRQEHTNEPESPCAAACSHRVVVKSQLCEPSSQACAVGKCVGALLGAPVGAFDGLCVGASVGARVGAGVGAFVGLRVGASVGAVVGCIEGAAVGLDVTKHLVSSLGSPTKPSKHTHTCVPDTPYLSTSSHRVLVRSQPCDPSSHA